MRKNSSTYIDKTKPWISLLVIIAITIGLSVIFVYPGILGKCETIILGLELSLFVCLCFPLLLLVVSVCYLIREFKRINRYQTGKWGLGSILNIPKSQYLKFMGAVMGISFSAGWALNILALWQGENGNIAKVLVHGAIAAFELFFLDINEDIFQEMRESKIFSGHSQHLIEGGIIIVSVLSTICMFSLMVNLFLTRMSAWIHNCFVKVESSKNNQLFIFFGVGEKEIALAKSIKKAYQDNDDPNDLIIYVDTRNDDEEKHNNWESIVSFLTVNNPIVPLINQDKHCMYLIGEAGFDKADLNNFWRSMGLFKIQKRINKLAKISRNNNSVKPELHFFFLSDDRDQNVDDSRILSEYLSKDKEIEEIPKVIYCQTRKSSVTSIIEDTRSDHDVKLEVRVIDDALLSVDVLKRKQISHPIRYVDIDLDENPGTIKSSFNSLIIGFGETGRDIFRYLYEFGSFLSSYENTKERSPFNCTVIDQYINNLKGSFISKVPALKDSAFNLANTHSNIHINFQNYSVDDVKYFEFLQRNIDSLNYVAIALGDDEINITVATEILKYARQYRDNFNNFRIFVRVYNNSSFSHLQAIAKHYNDIIDDEYGIKDIIVLFGGEIDIYKYDIIVKDEFARDGKEFGDTYWKYCEIVDNRIKENKRNLGIKDKDKPLSKQEARDKKKIALFQDRENAIHAITKLYIVGKFLQHHIEDKNKDIWEWLFNLFNVSHENIDSKRKLKSKNVEYAELSYCELPLNQLFTNLAITEHLRWNASHEILGFIYGEKKDYKHKTHSCLKPWDKLDDISDTNAIRLFDYLVVETSLVLKMKKSNLMIDLE